MHIQGVAAAVLLTLPCLLASGEALAGEGESALSLGVGYGTYMVPGEDGATVSATGGLVITATYERAFAEAFSLRADAAGAVYGGAGLSGVGLVDVGVVYRFDVLKYVPYAFGLLGGMYGRGGALSGDLDADGEANCDIALADCAGGFEPTITVGLGLDILRNRSTSWGIEARMSSFVSDTTLITVGARYTHRWGWF